MKPHRMRMTNELIIEYGLAEHLDVFVSNTFVHQACRSMMAFAETHAAATSLLLHITLYHSCTS